MSEMEAVNSFYSELQSLYDVKPPISKGKMTSITRAALKAAKLYKHVVQSVEKFIQKCKTEYKIPGLYVIDSIIRQSRHQFGSEKDVFAPRFSRNIQNTFVHLYRCPEEDKAKIIRVLNLWQKNRIFSPEVIQPLFDLADPQNPIWEQINSQNCNSDSGVNNFNNATGGGMGSSNPTSNTNNSQLGFPLPNVHFNKKLLDFDYGDGDDDGGVNSSGGKNSSDPANSSNNPNNASGGHLDALGSILSNPEILRQLQTLQEQMAAAVAHSSSSFANTPEQERQRKLAELTKQEAAFDQRLAETVARLPFAKDCELPLPPDGDSRGEPAVDQNSNQLAGGGGNGPNSNVLLPPPFFQQLAEQQQQSQHQQNAQQQQQLIQNLFRNAAAASQANQQNPFALPMQFPIQGVPPPFPSQDSSSSVPMFGQQSDSGYFNNFNNSQQQPQITISNSIYEEIDLCQDDSKDGSDIPGSLLHRERDRSGRSKRSRSRERHDGSRRAGRRSRSRSRSRGRNKRGYRSRSRDRARETREREKERHKKGLPPMKKEHLSVCSTTLWVGHLSKLVSQEEISDTFGKLGDIISIDLISPRGCAFIVMNRRQDAMRALDKLGNTKLQGKTITLAWAPGKGVKGKEWKDYWEVVDGVSYIPWNRMREDTNLEELEDGGCIDEDTLPDFLKNKPLPPADKSMEQQALMPPLPLDNENSQDSNSLVQPPLPPPNTSGGGPPLPPGAGQIPGLTGLGGPPHHSGIPSLLDPSALAAAVGGKAGDTDVRGDHPPMPPNPFGMGPPGLGMMPMGMNLMVPPPMLAMGGHHFQGMGNIPGLPPMMGMGMVPAPQMSVSSGGPSAAPGHHPGLGAPGLLGEMPLPTVPGVPASQQQLNDSMLHNINEESVLSSSEVNNEEAGGGRRGKKRSRFDDPEEKMSPPGGETSAETGNMSPSQLKDDRPVFERLKSLADGYSFGGDKPGGNSLLGTPPNLGHRPLIPNAFGQSPSLLGSRPPSLFAAAAGSQQPSAWGGFGDTSENPFLNPNPNNPFAAAASAGNPFVPANFGTSENPFDITANSQGNPFAPQNERGGFGGRRGGWGRDGEWGGRGNRGGRGRGNWRGGRGGGWGNDQHIEDLMETDVESRGGFRGGRGGRGGRNDNPWNSRSDKPGDRRSGERDRPRSREGDRGSSRGRRSRSPSSQRRDRDKNDRGNRRRRSSNDNSSDRRSRHRSRSGEDHHRSDRPWRQQEHSNAPNMPSDENWEADGADNEPGQPTQENVQNSECWEEGENDMSLDNNQLEEGGYEGGDQELTASHDQSADQWAGENDDDGPPGEDTYPHQEEQIKEDRHRNQYEQECIPQEEMEAEDEYPTQEETQYQDEEEEAQHCAHEGKTDSDGCGYTNNEEAFDQDQDGDPNAKFDDPEGDNEVDYGERKSEFENNEEENYEGEGGYSGDGDCEVYDNGDGDGEEHQDESYEQTNSHRDDDYSNYNNAEATDLENNGGNNSNNGEESRDYQNDCSAEAEPVPFSFGNTEEGNSEDGVGKCTSFVNSSSSKPVEEMNPISS